VPSPSLPLAGSRCGADRGIGESEIAGGPVYDVLVAATAIDIKMALRIARVFGLPLDDVFQYPDFPEVTT
jgi:hypothetical protein